MSRFEKLNLVFGVVGLLADIAALLTFSFNLHTGTSTNTTFLLLNYKNLFISITGMIIAYGWIFFSWLLAKYSFLRHTSKGGKSRYSSRGYSTQAVISIGVVLVPLMIIWLYALSKVLPSADNMLFMILYVIVIGLGLMGVAIIFAIDFLIQLLLF